MKKVSLLQPTYLPYPGYFQLMGLVDEFYYMTDVQYEERSWQQRNKIRVPRSDRCPDGWQWLKVPTVHYPLGSPERILWNVKIRNDLPWRQSHLARVGSYYKPSSYYELYYPEYEGFLMQQWERLAPLNIQLVEWLKARMGIRTPTMNEMAVPYDRDIDKTQRLVNFCMAVGAECYVEPEGASFIKERLFEEVGVELRFFHFEPPVYKQLYDGFVPYMSSLDLLFCLGPLAKNKLRSEWYDTDVRENLTPELDVGAMIRGGR